MRPRARSLSMGPLAAPNPSALRAPSGSRALTPLANAPRSWAIRAPKPLANEPRNRSLGALFAIALAVLTLFSPTLARAAPGEGKRPDAACADVPRPVDAPLTTAKRSVEPPPLPADYRELDQDGIRFAYHPSTRERIHPLFERVVAIRASLAALTGAEVLRRVEVRVAAVPAEMVMLSPGEVPASVATIAFFEPRLVVMSVVSPGSSPIDAQAALAHGLAHIALDEASGGAALPAWFHEGFALHIAGGADLARSRTLVDAAIFGRFLALEELSTEAARGGLADAQAADFVRFLVAAREARAAQPAFARLLRRVREGEPFDRAVVAALGAADRAAVESRWSEDRARRYAFVPVLLALLAAVGMLSAAWITIARARRARLVASLAAQARRERPVVVPKPARAPAKVAVAARLSAGRGRDAAIHVPRDPDVPKVEHNGEWHTLH